jgi:hypothetical protein
VISPSDLPLRLDDANASRTTPHGYIGKFIDIAWEKEQARAGAQTNGQWQAWARQQLCQITGGPSAKSARYYKLFMMHGASER